MTKEPLLSPLSSLLSTPYSLLPTLTDWLPVACIRGRIVEVSFMACVLIVMGKMQTINHLG
jgi:hypothetical protein